MKINKEMLEGSFKVSKTYEIWSHEDIEDGDTDNHGFEYDDRVFDNIWYIAKEIRENGPTYPSVYPGTQVGMWYYTEAVIEDYSTGEYVSYGFHPEGLDENQTFVLNELIKMSWDDFNKMEP